MATARCLRCTCRPTFPAEMSTTMRLKNSTRVGSGASPEAAQPRSVASPAYATTSSKRFARHSPNQQGSNRKGHQMDINTRPLGRRDFLRGSLAAAALAATGSLAACATSGTGTTSQSSAPAGQVRDMSLLDVTATTAVYTVSLKGGHAIDHEE